MRSSVTVVQYPATGTVFRRSSRLEFFGGLAEPADLLVHVGHLFEVGDDPEVEAAALAHDGDVQTHTVGDHRDG